MAKKVKKNVLWIVHTTANPAESETLKDANKKNLPIGPKWKITKEYEKQGKMKDAIDLHYEGLIRAMKIAQNKGMAIVFEAGTGREEASSKSRLMRMAKKEGVNTDSILFKHHRRNNLKQFFEGKGIKPNHFFLAGHFRDLCMPETATDIKIAYPGRVSILIGTPSLRSRIGMRDIRIYKSYGIATLNTLRTQKTLRHPEVRKKLSQYDYIRSLKPESVGIKSRKKTGVKKKR